MKILLTVLLFGFTNLVYAFPQFVKSGYFSCSSCHVSNSGGDALTAYGRGYAVEMLTATGKEGQAEPLWQADSLPDNLLLGGHFRWLQIFSDTAERRSGDNFWMQKDIDLGFRSQRFTAYVTAAELPLNPQADDGEWGIRKWLTRTQLNDYFSLQVGATLPKLGLMLNDHNASVNQLAGQRPGAESGRIEASYLSEKMELTLSSLLADLPVNSLGDKGNYKSQWAAYYAYFLAGEHRLAAGVLRSEAAVSSKSVSLSGTFTLNNAATTSVEIQQTQADLDDERRQVAAYLDLVYEPTRGVWIQPVWELLLSDYPDPHSKIEKQQLRLSLFPVPHFDVKLAIGQVKNHADYSFGNFGSILLHYWL